MFAIQSNKILFLLFKYIYIVVVVQKKVDHRLEEYMYSAVSNQHVNHVFILIAVVGARYPTLVFKTLNNVLP